jgi:preprotein translocase subunit YajC
MHMEKLFTFLAQGEAAPQAAAGGSMWQTLIMIGVIVLFFYFILYRPEQKRRKAMELKRSSLKKGDRVTAVGIIGVVQSLKDNSVVLRLVESGKVEVPRASITEVTAGAEEEKAEESPQTTT